MMNFAQKKDFYFQLKELVSAGIDYKEILVFFKVSDKQLDLLEKTSFASILTKKMKLNKFDKLMLESFDQMGKIEDGVEILLTHYHHLEEQARIFLSLFTRPAMLSALACLIFPLPGAVQGKINLLEYSIIAYGPMLSLFLLYRKFMRKSILRGTLIEDFPFLERFPIAKSMALSFYFKALSNLIEAGIDIHTSLDVSQGFASTAQLRKISKAISEGIEKSNLSELLVGLDLDLQVLSWITTYEQNGRLDVGFFKIAQLYEEKSIQDMRILAKWIPKLLYFVVVIIIAYNIIF